MFLAPREMLKVLHGDRVLVRPEGDYRGKPEGTIVEVIERRTDRLVGRYLKERGMHIVVPEDQRIKHDILIPKGGRGQAEHGQVVTVEIVQQPTRHTQPLGRIIEVLGDIDDAGMEIEIAVRKFDVPHEFSKKALAQADRIPDSVQPAELQGRVDLRDVPFITIDGEDARDFDDAVYCEPIELGTAKRSAMGWRLLVAIADVSHYVKPGDAIDTDAIERGTSVYFPRRVVPMLPEALSNGICSLNPGVDRLVLVCDMVIHGSGARAGQVKAYQFYEAVIRSHARTTYTEIWAVLATTSPPHTSTGTGAAYPECVRALSSVRRAPYPRRHGVRYGRNTHRDQCRGQIERIEPAVRNDAHRLIEEFMLAANTCGRLRRAANAMVCIGRTTPRLKTETVARLPAQSGLSLG